MGAMEKMTTSGLRMVLAWRTQYHQCAADIVPVHIYTKIGTVMESERNKHNWGFI